jgi:hypothetical protein
MTSETKFEPFYVNVKIKIAALSWTWPRETPPVSTT